jgi:hypothetical protein
MTVQKRSGGSDGRSPFWAAHGVAAPKFSHLYIWQDGDFRRHTEIFIAHFL